MRRLVVLAILMFGVPGCTEESLRPKPSYAAPTTDEATASYKAHLTAKLGEEVDPESIVAATGVTAANVDAYENARDRIENNAILRTTIGQLQKAEAVRCEWVLFDMRRFDRWGAPQFDAERAPPYAYWCTVDVVLSGTERGDVSALTDAYLFRAGDGWTFVGESASGWKPVAGES